VDGLVVTIILITSFVGFSLYCPSAIAVMAWRTVLGVASFSKNMYSMMVFLTFPVMAGETKNKVKI
jgi:hypothetical protein